MAHKVAVGNAMSIWVASTAELALQLDIPFWIENPAGSFLWLQAEWVRLFDKYQLQSLILDRLLSVRNAMAEAHQICWQVSSCWQAILVPVPETTCAIGRLQRGSRLLLDKGG